MKVQPLNPPADDATHRARANGGQAAPVFAGELPRSSNGGETAARLASTLKGQTLLYFAVVTSLLIAAVISGIAVGSTPIAPGVVGGPSRQGHNRTPPDSGCGGSTACVPRPPCGASVIAP